LLFSRDLAGNIDIAKTLSESGRDRLHNALSCIAIWRKLDLRARLALVSGAYAVVREKFLQVAIAVGARKSAGRATAFCRLRRAKQMFGARKP
jgi:hypothetical protein